MQNFETMDAKDRVRKKSSSSFDYEKEMEKALGMIFQNLRDIEESRFRMASYQCDEHQMAKPLSVSEQPCYIADLPALKTDREFQEVHKEQVTNVKSRRKLPSVPVSKGRIFPS